ncbi:MAG: hypothetical protein HZA46_11250 [Planctomycetales bacterium]|nr:hypothetical protein [Planctomycetales bacterium]
MPLIDHPIPYGAALNQTPVQDDSNNPGMGVLCRSDGVTSAADPAADDLTDGVWLLNRSNSDPAPSDEEMLQGIPAVVTGTGPTYSWHCNHDDPSAVNPVTAESNPTADNNSLYAFAAWKRNLGDAIFTPVPQRLDTTYAALSSQQCPAYAPPCPVPDVPIPKSKRPSKELKCPDGIAAKKKDDGWFIFNKVPPRTPRDGHRLRDMKCDPLRASRIEVYAFNMDWTHMAPGRLPQHVCHPVGDTLEVVAGSIFTSPLNSLLIWQANWTTRQRTLTIGESKRTADVIDLDPSKDIFVHVNYHRLTTLKIEGNFSLAVRVLKR